MDGPHRGLVVDSAVFLWVVTRVGDVDEDDRVRSLRVPPLEHGDLALAERAVGVVEELELPGDGGLGGGQ